MNHNDDTVYLIRKTHAKAYLHGTAADKRFEDATLSIHDSSGNIITYNKDNPLITAEEFCRLLDTINYSLIVLTGHIKDFGGRFTAVLNRGQNNMVITYQGNAPKEMVEDLAKSEFAFCGGCTVKCDYK